jgi:hypothetical protein
MLIINDATGTEELQVITTDASISNGTAVHIAGTWVATNTIALYENGSARAVNTLIAGEPTDIKDSSEHLGLGAKYDAGTPSNFFDGILEEIRISKIARTAAWIKATYYSNWNDLITYGSTQNRPIFLFNGYVRVEGSPAARTVHLFRRSTGELMDSVVSNSSSGYFEIGSNYNDYHFVVILPELAEHYNLLSYDKIHPEI